MNHLSVKEARLYLGEKRFSRYERLCKKFIISQKYYTNIYRTKDYVRISKTTTVRYKGRDYRILETELMLDTWVSMSVRRAENEFSSYLVFSLSTYDRVPEAFQNKLYLLYQMGYFNGRTLI